MSVTLAIHTGHMHCHEILSELSFLIGLINSDKRPVGLPEPDKACIWLEEIFTQLRFKQVAMAHPNVPYVEVYHFIDKETLIATFWNS